MRVVWLTHRDPLGPLAGGAEKTVLEVCSRLVKLGWEVWVASPGSRGASRESVIGANFLTSGNAVGVHLDLPMHIRQLVPDVVIHDLAHVLPWKLPGQSRVPCVAFFRHLHSRTLPGQVSWPVSLALSTLERLYPTIYNGCTFVTESRNSANDLAALGVSPTQIREIPPGVDKEFYHPAYRTPTPSLVYFSGLKRYKRPDHAIRLLRLLLDRGQTVSLIVVGDGPMHRELVLLSAALGLSDHVQFTGRVSAERLVEIISGSWVNISTSVAEGWGYAIMEASACGVPTVGYRVAGISEAVKEGVNGLLVRSGDLADLTDAASAIVSASKSWQSSSLGWASQFDWSKTAMQWSEVLHDAARRH